MKPTILLIEDDQWLADSYRATLSAQGYMVKKVTSARVAMTKIDEAPPALIVADVLLGDHTTFTLFHELQSYEDTARIPVILCTGVDTAQLSGADMRSYGIVQVFDKATMTPDQLLIAVREHVGEHGRPTR